MTQSREFSLLNHFRYAPIEFQKNLLLKIDGLETPLGEMVAIGDEQSLYVLEFIEHRELNSIAASLRKKMSLNLTPGKTWVIRAIEDELSQYFKGSLKSFQTPIKMFGSPFQKKVWSELQKIPIGETCSYADIAERIENPLAVRAVGRANGANPLTLIVPCHRVINANGALGGYGGGIPRKKWLLSHEQVKNF